MKSTEPATTEAEVEVEVIDDTPQVIRKQPPRRGMGKWRNPVLEDLLRELGLEFELQILPIDAINVEASRHNQVRFTAVNNDTVAVYTDALKRGAQFPAGAGHWVRNRFVIDDGNHRDAAVREAGLTEFGWYVVKGNAKALTRFAYEVNTRHGQPTSEAERVESAVWMVNGGSTHEFAASAVNLPVHRIRKVLNERAAIRRAQEVGLNMPEWDSLTPSIRTRLLQINTDEGFGAAAKLAYRAQMGSDEVGELVNEVNESRRGARQEAIVAHHADVLAERIQANAGGIFKTGGRRTMTPRTRLNIALGSLLSLPEDASQLVASFSAAERENGATRLREASARLVALAQELEQSS